MRPEERFQKTLVPKLKGEGLEVVELSDLMHPGGKPDLLILGHNYFYLELKVNDRKRNFPFRKLFQPTQLPYYYGFLSLEFSDKISVATKYNNTYIMTFLNKALVKLILDGMSFDEIRKGYSWSFRNIKELVNYIKGDIA